MWKDHVHVLSTLVCDEYLERLFECLKKELMDPFTGEKTWKTGANDQVEIDEESDYLQTTETTLLFFISALKFKSKDSEFSLCWRNQPVNSPPLQSD